MNKFYNKKINEQLVQQKINEQLIVGHQTSSSATDNPPPSSSWMNKFDVETFGDKISGIDNRNQTKHEEPQDVQGGMLISSTTGGGMQTSTGAAQNDLTNAAAASAALDDRRIELGLSSTLSSVLQSMKSGTQTQLD
eukprot:Trichotokara_eunicae@DN4443_c0_g1_i1.p2